MSPSRLKKPIRKESNLMSQNQSIRSQKFSDQFQIQSANGSDDDDEEKTKADE